MHKQELIAAMRLAAGRRKEAMKIADWAEENLKEMPYGPPRQEPMTDARAKTVIEKTRKILASVGIPTDVVPADREGLEKMLAEGPRIHTFAPPKGWKSGGKMKLIFLRPENADSYLGPVHTAVMEPMLSKHEGKHFALMVRDQSPLAPFWIGLAALRVCLYAPDLSARVPHKDATHQGRRLAFGLINDATQGEVRRILRLAKKGVTKFTRRDAIRAAIHSKIGGPHPPHLDSIVWEAVMAIHGFKVISGPTLRP